MIGILVKIVIFQFKLFANNGTKFGAPGNRTPLPTLKLVLITNVNLKIQPCDSSCTRQTTWKNYY